MSYQRVLLLLFISLAAKSQCLRCRVDQDTRSQEEFEDIVRMCLRHDLQKGDRRPWNTTNRYDRNEDYNYDYEDDNKRTQNDNGQRSRYPSQPSGYQPGGGGLSPSRQGQGGRNSSSRLHSPLGSIDPCIIHCIFKHKKMLRNDNTIDKSNTLNVLTRKVRNSQLREFIEDSVNECFDKLENRRSEGKCEDSKNLALCLEDKGKQNCDDWNSPDKNKRDYNSGKPNSNDDNQNYNPNGNSNQRPYNGNNANNQYGNNNNQQYNNKRDRNEWTSGGCQTRDFGGPPPRRHSSRYNPQAEEGGRRTEGGTAARGGGGEGGQANRTNKKQDDADEGDRIRFPNYFQNKG